MEKLGIVVPPHCGVDGTSKRPEEISMVAIEWMVLVRRCRCSRCLQLGFPQFAVNLALGFDAVGRCVDAFWPSRSSLHGDYRAPVAC